jgi:hypothetical protein
VKEQLHRALDWWDQLDRAERAYLFGFFAGASTAIWFMWPRRNRGA